MDQISAADAVGAATSAHDFLLDVREPDEWDAGHAAAATSIPMSQLQDRIGEVPSSKRLLVVCRSGARSAKVTAALKDAGYDAVNVDGGMRAWVISGGDLESSSGDLPQVI